jgi:hypothetical protein
MKKPHRFQREKRWFINRRKSMRYGIIFLGILSTIWFLIRVIPKPSRASYPCMQLAAPFASTFLIYIASLFGSVIAFRRLRQNWFNRNYPSVFLFSILLVISLAIWVFQPVDLIVQAKTSPLTITQAPNEPIGEARGIHPGRVVWIWNPDVTNENCSNQEGDYWWQDENTDQLLVDEMFSNALLNLTGASNDSIAWDDLFRHFNQTHGNGNTGFTPGEKIAIKVNICSGGWGNVDESTYEKINWKGMIDTSPHLIITILDQLVNTYGVPEEDIYLGDPIRLFFDHYWEMVQGAFPGVNYLDWLGNLGRYKVNPSEDSVLNYSDGSQKDCLPQSYLDASYMINIGCLKQHDCAGVTFCAKNHFGSICREWAMHLHYALPSPTVNGFENLGYGKYRNLVDLMQHKDLGEKTFLFVIDGLWGGDLPVCDPLKWQSVPFNNDWPSSILLSQDHVAIESVGADFVMAEFQEYSTMLGSDDYLHQAADSANWADGIMYDPDGDGQFIASSGVHEHWNNNTEKLYSRNLGIGDGIELVQLLITGVGEEMAEDEFLIYPNPATEYLNIKYPKPDQGSWLIEIFTIGGELVGRYENTSRLEISTLSSGLYIIRLKAGNSLLTQKLAIR